MSTQIPTGMPPIVYAEEAAEAWAERLACMAGWNITVTKTDGTEVECQIHDTDTNEPDGFYTLVAHEGHNSDLRYSPPAEPALLRFRSDEIAAVVIH